ncbi:hypothetical protein [Mucilaginibacter sp.]|uniref:hypothetical protein n=1 Tax=Mucilaginibacter sp. TaxID=1882438 RepID=UPI002614F0F1|nr:hypothetical protein [Mucilaginibacter sp.]
MTLRSLQRSSSGLLLPFFVVCQKDKPNSKPVLAVALAIAVSWITRILVIDIQLGAYFPRWSRLPLSFKATIFFTSSIKVFDICTFGSHEKAQ